MSVSALELAERTRRRLRLQEVRELQRIEPRAEPRRGTRVSRLAKFRPERDKEFRQLARPVGEHSDHRLAVDIAQRDIVARVNGDADAVREPGLASLVEAQSQPSRSARRDLYVGDLHADRVSDVTNGKPWLRHGLVFAQLRLVLPDAAGILPEENGFQLGELTGRVGEEREQHRSVTGLQRERRRVAVDRLSNPVGEVTVARGLQPEGELCEGRSWNVDPGHTDHAPNRSTRAADLRTDLGARSHLRAEPHTSAPERGCGHGEGSEHERNQLPPRIIGAVLVGNRCQTYCGGDAGAGCCHPFVTAAHNHAAERAQREDRQRSGRERRLDTEGREREEDGDEYGHRADPSHPSILGRTTPPVNRDERLAAPTGRATCMLFNQHGPQLLEASARVVQRRDESVALVVREREPSLATVECRQDLVCERLLAGIAQLHCDFRHRHTGNGYTRNSNHGACLVSHPRNISIGFPKDGIANGSNHRLGRLKESVVPLLTSEFSRRRKSGGGRRCLSVRGRRGRRIAALSPRRCL